MSILYVVATPIGNLQDITFRAVEVLKTVDAVACEDTRHTGRLLAAYDVKKQLVSCHSNSGEAAIERILGLLEEGKSVAYATDAGTPGISDPGALIIGRVREAGHRVVPIPGPSAAAALISAAGIPGRSYTFDGFLSPKRGKREKRLQELLAREENIILYESPHRIVKLLELLADLATNRVICIGREMTKLHEEIITGTPTELIEHLEKNAGVRGEFTLFITGNKNG